MDNCGCMENRVEKSYGRPELKRERFFETISKRIAKRKSSEALLSRIGSPDPYRDIIASASDEKVAGASLIFQKMTYTKLCNRYYRPPLEYAQFILTVSTWINLIKVY